MGNCPCSNFHRFAELSLHNVGRREMLKAIDGLLFFRWDFVSVCIWRKINIHEQFSAMMLITKLWNYKKVKSLEKRYKFARKYEWNVNDSILDEDIIKQRNEISIKIFGIT